ncbi:MAG TPA: tetratricopeptide repeat protein, partial [Terriglobales bacterium]|nr:tetratricopeptide repeat protein [Terriglobales bacterium]
MKNDLAIQKAGLQKDDLLLHWKRGDLRGDFESPFDLYYVAREQAPRGQVSIEGFRGQQERVWVIGEMLEGITGRPNLNEPVLSAYQTAKELAQQHKSAEAAESFRLAADMVQKSSTIWLRSWILFQAALMWADAGDWDKAKDTYQSALQAAAQANPAFRAGLLEEWAWKCWSKETWSQGALNDAEAYHRQALEEWQSLGTETMTVANSLQTLGMLANYGGDLAAAEDYDRHALAIEERLAPESLCTAIGLGGMGSRSHARGDLVRAEGYYRRALAIEEKLHPGSRNFAYILTSLGSLAHERGDALRAEKYHREALDVFSRLSPGDLNSALILVHLGRDFLLEGDTAKAEECLKRSLEIGEKLAPGGYHVSLSLHELGDAASAREDSTKAEQYYEQALAIQERMFPGSMMVAGTLDELARLRAKSGNLTQAEADYRRALAIWEKVAPDGSYSGESLAGLAAIMHRRERPEEATQLYDKAITALETQSNHLGGGDEAHTNLRAQHANAYKEYIDLLLSQKKTDIAFQVLERLRARTLLESLAAARVDIRKGVDSALVERERSLKELLNAKWNRRMQLPNNEDRKEQLTVLDKEINDLLAQYKDVEQLIR